MNLRKPRGFTLIEALVTISILAIVTSLAVPNLRDFMVSNKMANLSNEFSSAVLQTRALAVSKNACATLCASTDISASGGTGTCSNSTTDDFQKGWLVFVNKACTDTLTTPPAGSITVLRRGDGDNAYSITLGTGGKSMVMFDPRGYSNLPAAAEYKVNPPASADAKFKRAVCVDAAGRPTVRQSCS